MSSLTLTDKQLEKKYGRRQTGAQLLDEPQELGYICPKGHGGDYLTWSEFKDFIWCRKCQTDYHYAADCQLKRMCWMTDEQWEGFVGRLPTKPTILEGIQHFPDCKITHVEVKIITMCGSSKFCDIMAVCAWLIEKKEHAITLGLHLLPRWYCKVDDHLAESEGVSEEMDKLTLKKIDMSDEVFVVNFNDYIGDSTRREVEYALSRKKTIRWFTHDPIGLTVQEFLNGGKER